MNPNIKIKNKSTSEDKHIETFITNVVTSFIKDGSINPVGKTRAQLLDESLKIIRRVELQSVIDHTDDVLDQARIFKKAEKKELACLFYAVWLEHTLNSFIYNFAKRLNFSEKEIEDIIRDTSYKSKVSWLLRLFGEKPFSSLQIKSIIKLMEARNAFVHYKWKPINEQKNNEIDAILASIEKTVKYVKNYENKNVLGISKRNIQRVMNRS